MITDDNWYGAYRLEPCNTEPCNTEPCNTEPYVLPDKFKQHEPKPFYHKEYKVPGRQWPRRKRSTNKTAKQARKRNR